MINQPTPASSNHPRWVVITGGCGYVGSHVASALRNQTDLKILLIDNRANTLPHTHANADEILDVDFSSSTALAAITKTDPCAVIHCAASSLVTPSVTNPMRYYENNVVKMKVLLDHLSSCKTKNIVFSSSSSVYGDGDGCTPINETSNLEPISPYGTTKLIGEMMLNDYHAAYGINCISFRYFNAVGADPTASIGQEPSATHLIARIMESLLSDLEFSVYGADYPTPDGTCIRDYVHVSDIARAHVAGMNLLLNKGGKHTYNIGSGCGYSVLEIVSAVERVTGQKVKLKIDKRRPGDPAWRIADTGKLNGLGWSAEYDLDHIVRDAYRWYNSNTFKSMR